AAAEIRALAESLGIPVATEIGGRGIVSDDHELSVSLPTAHRLWSRVDVVLAVGTRLRRPYAEWGVAGLRIIRVDVDEREIHRVAPPEVALVGDAASIVRALADGLPPAGPGRPRTDWTAAVAVAKSEVEQEISTLVPQVDYLDAMRAALPDDGYFVDELTQVGYTARVAFPVRRPSTYISSTYLGALGFGYASALGVKIAHPERPVLSISGDGGFLYTAMELATAVQHGIGVVAVVFNDSSYANVERSQRNYMKRALGTDLLNPDFAALAESFGAYGVLANDPPDLRTEIEKGFTRTRIPTVIEVPVGDLPNPWPFIRLPKVR
ncbi:thiamine pyrophosphate-dependent enzyme, partial [Nocardia sp. NPDC005978]|uniref:thiamine pyrophosphate-dependent enzyme n=1 Tax=Nocardia sp. NPDC005978 TaxID=3156725 RepID=UPI0033A19BDD